METTFVHLGNVLLTGGAIYFIIRLLYKTPLNRFVTEMVLLSMFIMVNSFLFSTVDFIDGLNGSLFNPYFYNYWSLFIRIQSSMSILWIAIKAWRKYKV